MCVRCGDDLACPEAHVAKDSPGSLALLSRETPDLTRNGLCDRVNHSMASFGLRRHCMCFIADSGFQPQDFCFGAEDQPATGRPDDGKARDIGTRYLSPASGFNCLDRCAPSSGQPERPRRGTRERPTGGDVPCRRGAHSCTNPDHNNRHLREIWKLVDSAPCPSSQRSSQRLDNFRVPSRPHPVTR